jgi:acetyl-CoA carboxylase biotin carboxyl carrier protein
VENLAESDNTTDKVRRLAEIVVEHGLTELTVEEDGVTITVKAEIATAFSHAPVAYHAHMPQPASSAASTPAASAPVSKAIPLESPMVGVFYRSPSPEDPPFINVGDIVHIGQVIGLIEAMKVYSEVPAEASGRVTEISAENGSLVQQGEPLYLVEPM